MATIILIFESRNKNDSIHLQFPPKFITQFDFSSIFLNIVLMLKPDQEIKQKIKAIVDNRSIVLPLDEAYYLTYLLGNNFVEDAAKYLLEGIEKFDNVVRKESSELKEIIEYAEEKARIEAEIQSQPELTEDEVALIAMEFVESHGVHGELDMDSIAHRPNHYNQKNDSLWTINIKLLPPSSLKNRVVEIVISKRTRAVTTMANFWAPKPIL